MAETRNPAPGATGDGAAIDTDRGPVDSSPEHRAQDPRDILGKALAAHFKYERANVASRRFLSRCTESIVRRSDIIEFLRKRREPLESGDIEQCADEAIKRWLSSRANRYR